MLLIHLQGHYEWPPYTNDTMRSAYHVRELDVFRLAQLKRPLDIGLSHDWPAGIAHHGNKAQLFRAKSFLQKEVHCYRCVALSHLKPPPFAACCSCWSSPCPRTLRPASMTDHGKKQMHVPCFKLNSVQTAETFWT